MRRVINLLAVLAFLFLVVPGIIYAGSVLSGGVFGSNGRASGITYDNDTSGLAADDVQEALDEVVDDLSGIANTAGVSDTAYDATAWNGETTLAPSKNAVRDKIVSMESALESHTSNDIDPDRLLGDTTDNNLIDSALLDSDLVTWAGLTPSAYFQTLVDLANAAAVRNTLGVEIGADVQAYDADLTTWATLTPSANFQSLAPLTWAQMRTTLGLSIGTNVQAYDADLTTYAGITPSANAQSLLALNWAQMRTSMGVQASDSDLTTLSSPGNWKVFYSDGSGNIQVVSCGADGTYLRFNGAAAAPTADTPSGSGDMLASVYDTDSNNQPDLADQLDIASLTAITDTTSGTFNNLSLVWDSGGNNVKQSGAKLLAWLAQEGISGTISDLDDLPGDTVDDNLIDKALLAGAETLSTTGHVHTGSTLSGIDISDDTNLAGTTNEIVLTGDTLSLASAVTRDAEWDSESEVQTAWGSVNILLETEIDASSELYAIMDDETGSGGGTPLLVFNYNPTLTGATMAGNITLGSNEIQSTSNIVLQLGDNAGTNKFSIQDSDSAEIFSVDSNGGITAARSATPNLTLQDSDCTDSDINYKLGANATDTGSGSEDIDITEQIQIAGTLTTIRSVNADGNYEIGTASMPVSVPGNIIFTVNDSLSPSAGLLGWDGLITGLNSGGLKWNDGAATRILVDLDTAPSNDDYVVAYDADNDKFYMKQDSTGAGSLSLAGDGSPDGQIQYANDANDALAAEDAFYYEADTNTLYVDNLGAHTVAGLITISNSMDAGGATAFEIPNSDDPDVDATGQIALDTDGWLRVYQNSLQKAVPLTQEIQVTVVKPNDLADATRDAFCAWENVSGMSFIITGWSAASSTDDTTLNLEETDADGQNNATIDAVEIATNGTGIYTASDTTITAATVETGHRIWIDFDDTDDPGWVKITIYGYFLADVN